MTSRGPLSVLLAGAAMLLVGACSPVLEPDQDLTGRPLLDDLHQPDVLTEAQRLDQPPSLEGNRFLTGWWPWRDGAGQVRLNPNPDGARLEFVHLEEKRRRLVLDLLGVSPGGRVVVQAAGRDLGAFALRERLEIPLPEDLPRGRLPVDLRFEDAPKVTVAGAGLRPSAPAGEVTLEEGALIQAGSSMVEMVRPNESFVALTGRFTPPSKPEAGQRFEIRVEDGSKKLVDHWTWSAQKRFGKGGRFRLDLASPRPWLRIRLRATGEGPPGRWEHLRLVEDSGLADDAEEATAPGMPEPVAPRRPRLVVLYVLDALRADALGAWGARDGATPTLDRLAEEGLVFQDHQSVAPNTLPSTKALLTGIAPRFRGGWQLPADGPPTLAEAFAAAGFRTGLFSGNVYVSDAYGIERGFEAHELIETDPNGDVNASAEEVHARALAWLESLPEEASVFLYLHTLHPHNPYAPPGPSPPSAASSIDGSTRTLLDLQRGRRTADDEDEERLKELYAAGLAYNDGQIARLLARLGERFAPDETLVAVTSDHGEELFEHGGVLHGYTLYEEMIHIPLILWAPDRLSPGRVEWPTTTLDLHAALSKLARREPLTTIFEADLPTVHFAAAASVPGGIFSARTKRYKLIWAPRQGLGWGLGEGLGRSREPEYLFNLRADPGERTNIAGDRSFEADWLRERLRAWIDAGRPIDDNAPPPEEDAETRRQLEALGYLGG
ncbi:MAG: sulfatase [Acidobacteriota bacterium]